MIKPNPGSLAAVRDGCLCPVMDNNHGAGIPTKDGPIFWMNSGCPIHDESTQCPDCQPGPGKPCLPNCPTNKGYTK